MKKISLFLLTVIFFTAVFTSCKNSLSGKITIADGKEPFTLNQDMVSRLAALAVTGNCKLDEQQVEDNVLSALSALTEKGNERAAVTVKDFSLSVPKVSTLKVPSSLGKTERSANIQSFDDIKLYLYSTNEGKGNEGWILASNDLRVGTIIAIVDGKYSEDYEEENPFMDIFYAGLENHILETVYTWNSLTEEDIRAASPNKYIGENSNYKVKKAYYIGNFHTLLNTKWNQNPGYNDFIKAKLGISVTDNGYPAGCVAVAVGQICTYWHYPKACSREALNELKRLNCVPSDWNGKYNYNKMIHYDHYMPAPVLDDLEEDGQMYVKTLLYDIGKGVNMVYGSSSSSASVTDTISWLRSNGFSCDYDSNYDFPHIVNSLDLRRPVLIVYYSKDQDKYTGHAWVIDDYAHLNCLVENTNTKRSFWIEDDYVHCNFGWGGQCNGYYISEVFNADKGPEVLRQNILKNSDDDFVPYYSDVYDDGQSMPGRYYHYFPEVIYNITLN